MTESRDKAEPGAAGGPLITRDHAVAHHEAAHLVSAIALGLGFGGVSIERDTHAGPGGAVELAADQPMNEDVAVACLAGVASSEILLGSRMQEIAPEQLLAS